MRNQYVKIWVRHYFDLPVFKGGKVVVNGSIRELMSRG